MASHTGMFPPAMVPQIYEMLLRAPENKNMMIQAIDFKYPITALILSLLLGYIGIDRFYLGDIGLGIAKILTGGGCGVWTIIDWFIIMDAARKKNYEMLANALAF